MAHKPLIEEPPLRIIEICKTEGDNSFERLDWEYLQEFLRGRPFTFQDTTRRQLVNLAPGMIIPGTNMKVKDMGDRPVDNHLVTIGNSLTAKAISNYPFLIPQVIAATPEDRDRDTAITSTKVLTYYQKKLNEEELYRKLVGYMKPCGQAYLKTYWDKTAGGPGEVIDGQKVPRGDVACRVNSAAKMLIPPGIPNDADLPWIGEQNALGVDKIFDTWGVQVEEEDGLENLDSLQSMDCTEPVKKQKLKGHARVFEIYFRPCKKYPLGRLIIGTLKKIFYDSGANGWDPKLVTRYPDAWHPYTRIPWMIIEGDYWAKSPLFYLIHHQKQLNKLYYRLVKSKKTPLGAWVYQEQNGVDWNRISWDNEDANIRIPYKAQAPTYVKFQSPNTDIINEITLVVQRMNDNAADYEVTRGQRTPGVNSGVQQQQLQANNAMQNSPLLSNLAKGFLNGHWKMTLRLLVVHLESSGRLLQITGEEGEITNLKFTPDQITFENITLATGLSFYLPPEQRAEELDRTWQLGAFGPPQSPSAIKTYMRLRQIGGNLEGTFAELAADEQMAELENMRFQAGDFLEKDQIEREKLLNGERPAPSKETAAFLEWQQMSQMYGKAMQQMATGQVTPGMQMAGPPPLDPGPQPPVPTVYMLARDYEDHDTHIKKHNKLRKNRRFEEACLANPELRKATDFHVKSHTLFMQPPMPIPPASPTSPPGGGIPPVMGPQ